MKLGHRKIRSNVNDLNRFHDEGPEVTTLSNSCWRLLLLVVSYLFDVPEGKHKSGVRHGATVYRSCIRCFGSREGFRSMDCAVNMSTAVTLNARENTRWP